MVITQQYLLMIILRRLLNKDSKFFKNLLKITQGRVKKTRVFSCVLLLMDVIVVILHKKGYSSPLPHKNAIMKSYAAVATFFFLL